MSKCISSEGEYSDHHFGDAPEFTCDRCWVFDEDEALAEIDALRATLRAVLPTGNTIADVTIRARLGQQV